jgi:hypothetical protein
MNEGQMAMCRAMDSAAEDGWEWGNDVRSEGNGDPE